MLAVFAYQLASVTTDLASAQQTRDRILREIADRLERSGMSVEVVSDQGVLRLSNNAINFPSGSETPKSTHYPNVGRVARAIAEVVPCYVADVRPATTMPVRNGATREDLMGSRSPLAYCMPPVSPEPYACRETGLRWHLETLLIEGHTDEVPVAVGNRFRDNIELSSMRAATVHRMISACEPRVERLAEHRPPTGVEYQRLRQHSTCDSRRSSLGREPANRSPIPHGSSRRCLSRRARSAIRCP